MKTAAVVCLGLLCVSSVIAQSASAPETFSPTESIAAAAPNPSSSTRVRTGSYASDSLANTQTSYNQIQTVGVYSAAHIAPEPAILEYLANVTTVTGLATAGSPNSTEFSQEQLYNQLETVGARQFHFPIYYDPTGKLYQDHAGLAIVNDTSANVTSDDIKWTYPGWKIMSEPNFDFNSTCTTLVTCLQNIKNWMLITPDTVPITVFLEPLNYTYTGNGSNATFATALAESTTTDAPSTLNQPLDIISFQPYFQPWRDLENELLEVFDYNEYETIVTPEDVLDGATTLKSAVLQNGYTLYPTLSALEGRIIFVLSSYVSNYLEYRPNLANATMFVSEAYNSAGNYTDSTLFVDFLGNLPGINESYWNATTEKTDSATVATQITATVESGYMVRAAADWQTIEPRYNYSSRATSVLSAGAHFVQTSFPVTPTYFASSYSVALPIRGNVQQSANCNPITTGGLYFNATEVYSTGCPAVTSSPASAPSSTTTTTG